MSGLCTFEQQLAFLHVVVEARLDVDDAAAGQRDDGNFASDIGIHRSGDVQARRGASIRFALTSENCSGLSTVTRLMLPVLDDLRRRRRTCSPGSNFFSHAVSAEPDDHRASASLRRSELVCRSLDYLTSYSKIQLAGSG